MKHSDTVMFALRLASWSSAHFVALPRRFVLPSQHFSSTPAHEAERYKPQLITDPNSAPLNSPPPVLLATGVDASSITAPPSAATVAAAAPQAIGGSRWNAAGTWEDKDISVWAHGRFKEVRARTTAGLPSAPLTWCLQRRSNSRSASNRAGPHVPRVFASCRSCKLFRFRL